MVTNILRFWGCIFLLSGIAMAQTTQPGPPNAPSLQPGSTEADPFDWWAYVGLACGAGASIATTATRPTAQCGAIANMGPIELETGVMGPQARQSNVSAYLSTNLWFPLMVPEKAAKAFGVPLVTGGYTRMFETGHALDYGAGFARALDASHSLRFEVRDYWEFSNAHQHNVVFRVAWMLGLPD